MSCERLRDHAACNDPEGYNAGIESMLVNGHFTIDAGRPAGALPGTGILRHQGQRPAPAVAAENGASDRQPVANDWKATPVVPHTRAGRPSRRRPAPRLPRLAFMALMALVPLLVAAAARPAATQRANHGDWPIDLATAPRPAFSATPAAGPIRIDGRLDEPGWQGVSVISSFVQVKPRAGFPATERTEVRITYDDRSLYISAVCYDSDPHGIVVNTLERDSNTLDTDAFGVALDTFLDRQNAFAFFVNPQGAIRDGQTFNDSRNVNFQWDGVFESATEVHDSGWTAEMAIPWRTLRFEPTGEERVWGINLLRRIRRKNEDAYWAPLERHEVLYTMSRAGTIHGLRPSRPGHNLYVKPYGLTSRAAGTLLDADQSGGHYDAGVDLKYVLTPGLALDLTYRTDFSQVEVDQEQVNLTRFSLFFPEKRDFFLENSGTFAFGDMAERNQRSGASLRDLTLFHSRRIGLTPEGEPLPIHGGGRLTGSAGAYELGLLNMQTASTPGTPAENITVTRIRRKTFGTSDIGVIFVNRQATGSASNYNRSYGADANLRFLGSLVIHSYVAATSSPDASGDNRAARLSVGWRDRLWDASAFVRHVGDAFDPGVGFVRRSAVRHGYATLGVHPRVPFPHVQEVNPYVELHYITDLASVLETRRRSAGFAVEMLDGGAIDLQHNEQFERLVEPFRVRSGSVVAPGDYTFRETSVSYTSSRARSFSANTRLQLGGFYDGERTALELGAIWRPTYRWSISVSADHNAVRLPDSRFTADVYSTRVKYSHTTHFHTSAYVQYNKATEQLVTNLRLNFIHAPLSDFFVVYTERRDWREQVVLERGVTLKFTRMLAF
ncbi:MAG: carbohydrate binding family 9 domain-containing protein [Gemmatimonadetes bacterium]|nr:carbohydrate binding family 9 domain-containing protein [Gemmatimonadota bacterium]